MTSTTSPIIATSKLVFGPKRKLLHYDMKQIRKSLKINSRLSICHFLLHHQVPNSLLIFTSFSAAVWIATLLTVILSSLAYTVLLTVIDDLEESKRKWSINFSNH